VSASLKSLVIRGSSWTVFASGFGQLIRLLSNLVLTRLLFPEAFGVMALVWMVLFGLEMMSDVGLNAAVIREERGEQPEFLKTVWTIQVARGVILTILAVLVAYPMALFYGEPQLFPLVAVAGISALISGFTSVSRYTEQRRMNFKRITLLELFSQLFTVVVVIVWAMFNPTVWALVGSALIGKAAYVIGSHIWLPPGHRGFAWDRHTISRLLNFGKWILPASILTFIAIQGDRMLLGYYLDLKLLGIYSVAILLAEAAIGLMTKLNYTVAYPAYSRTFREAPDRLPAANGRLRLGLDILAILPVSALMVVGAQVVEFLYDERYHPAGWMFQALCIKILMSATLTNSEVLLVAIGQPKYALWLNAGRTTWILLGIPIAWHLFGLTGVVWAVALSELPVACALWVGLVREGRFLPLVEARTISVVVMGLIAGTLVLWAIR
jgi:O-antigen/teichoic acid export membrane protein